MRKRLFISLFSLGVAACAAPEKQTDVAGTEAAPRQRCDTLQTGSNLRCNRSDVRVTTREEADRDRQITNPTVPTTSSPTRGSTR